jgi:hypothetical protein
VALLAAAVWAAARQGESLPQAWESLKVASPWLIAAALGLPLVNLVLVSLSFWVLMRREGRISPAEMFCLIGAAWLLNFAPLRPGLIGRVAYHRAVNGIPVGRAVWVTGVGIAAGAAAVAVALGLAGLLRGCASPWVWVFSFAAVLAATAATVGVLAARGSRRWVYGATFGLRLLDIAVWVVRYAALFALVGRPISLPGAVAVTAVCQVVLVVPFVGNGLGLREWAVGLMASALPREMVTSGGNAAVGRAAMRNVGLAADLVNRAAELVVAVPLGLLCSAWLAQRIRRNGLARPGGTAV